MYICTHKMLCARKQNRNIITLMSRLVLAPLAES